MITLLNTDIVRFNIENQFIHTRLALSLYKILRPTSSDTSFKKGVFAASNVQ